MRSVSPTAGFAESVRVGLTVKDDSEVSFIDDVAVNDDEVMKNSGGVEFSLAAPTCSSTLYKRGDAEGLPQSSCTSSSTDPAPSAPTPPLQMATERIMDYITCEEN